MGRRSKYTPETVAKIVEAIKLGATYELAAGYAGISVDTVARWQAQYADFADKLREAEGRSAVMWLAKIEAAANIDWKAAAWKLERRHPQAFGKSVQDINVTHSGTINHRDASAFTDAEIESLAAIAERRKAGELVS